MTYLRYSRNLCVLVISLLFVMLIIPEQSDSDEKDMVDKAITNLVESLASPNAKPTGMNPGAPDAPQNYDERAQLEIKNNLCKLTQIGERAFPQLIDHIDDTRYCLTEYTGTGYYNRDVGYMCRRIIRSHIDGAIEKVTGKGSKYLRTLKKDRKKLTKEQWSKWWSENKKRGLLQIQQDAIDLAIQTEKDASVLAALQTAQRELKASGQPLPPHESQVTRFIRVSPIEKIRDGSTQRSHSSDR